MKVVVKLLIFFLVILKQSESIQINCEFRMNSQECKVNSLKVLETDMEVTSIAGVYGNQKSNKDVKEFWIDRGVDTQRVPANICKFFATLERIDIYGSQIIQISRNVFENCSKLKKVCILFTSLAALPEDLFEDLGELTELFIYENKLVILPENLIAKNFKLTSFNARNNHLIIIDIDFGKKITNIDLSNNKCIDKSFPKDILNLSVFKKLIVENCENPMKKSLELKANEIAVLKISLAEKEKEIRSLKSEKELHGIEKNNLSSKVSKLEIENANFKVENDGRRIEIEAIKMNNTNEIAAVIDENILLKENAIKCRLNVSELSNEIKKLNNKNGEMAEEVKKSQVFTSEINLNITSSLQANLNLMDENLRFKDSLEECRQNFSNANEEFNLKITALENKFSDLLNETYRHSAAEVHSISSKNCDHKIYFHYFIILGLLFALILVVAVFCIRRHYYRVMFKHSVNNEVIMSSLLNVKSDL